MFFLFEKEYTYFLPVSDASLDDVESCEAKIMSVSGLRTLINQLIKDEFDVMIHVCFATFLLLSFDNDNNRVKVGIDGILVS